MASNGTIDIEAKSADDTKGSITAIAETIKGKAVNLSATRDISLEAAENTYDSQFTNTSSGWSVGTSISPVSGMSPNVSVGLNKAKEDGNTHQTSHTGTKVVGTESVTIQSGQDTNIIGSQVQGEEVTAKVGKDLNITSLQDVNDYHETSSASGLNLSIGDITKLGAKGANITGGASYSKGKMDSNYVGVTEQAGIYAGAGGFHVETQGITSLTGAVIDSTVDSKEATSKNTLTTGDLVLKDIENKADYKVSSKGIAYNKFEKGTPNTYNEKGLIPVLMPGASDKDSSVTKAAIGAGTITVKNQPNFDVAKLNRDTQNSLNKLGEIFDKKKIEERQELAKLIAKDAFNQLHYWQPKTKEDKAAKAIAHGIVGEIADRVAGSAPGSGFTATMTNETLADRIFNLSNNHPDMAQWLSSILGNVVNNVLKKEASVGAATAQYSLKWNLIGDGHPDEKIVSVALGIDHHSYGHASLIFGFSGGGYEEVNYGRYGAVPHYLSVASPVGEGVYAFDYKYYLGKDDKTLYFLNINANDAAYVYNSMIEGNGYYKYDKYGQPNKSLKIGRDVNNNLIWAGDVYRKIETEDDYILWEWNCLTSSVYPLTYVSSKDNYYLNSLANRIAPDSANWVLQRDYEQYRGGSLVAWIYN